MIFAGSGFRPAPAGIRCYRSRVTDLEAAPVPFRTLRRSGSHASSESTPQPGLFIIRQPTLWTSLWGRMHGGEEPQPATPEVDWDSEMVVALVLGWRPTTGYAVDYTIPKAKWRPGNTDLASSCGQNTSVAVREVLDIGSGDTYGQYLPGQSFEVTDLPNGTYYIETLANPDKKLAESNTENNSSVRKVVLGGTPEKRTLRVPAVHGLDGPK